MPVPTYDQLVAPLLRLLLAEPEGLKASVAQDRVARQVGLSAADMGEMLPSGRQLVYRNRISWAHDRLKRAGLSSSPRRGHWQLTPAGVTYARRWPGELPEEELARLVSLASTVRLRPESATTGAVEHHGDSTEAAKLAPDDRIELALREIEASVAAHLLELIAAGSPTFFEKLVLDLLHAMGYGLDADSIERVGGSGDGGIDGIISLDRLGLEKVYVQAKRWSSTVGRPQVQAFAGALLGRGASKGVFITTSTYSREATEFARNVPQSIVLVDGQRLGRLMIENEGVGVSHWTIKVPKVDGDYFEEG